MSKQSSDRIRIRLKAYDYKLLDRAARDIADSAMRSGAEIRGPFPLPTTINKWTVLRGPHVNKKSREQFERRTHHRLLDILMGATSNKQTLDALSKVELPAGVHVRIKQM
jgi:small subunit ribosomal protein S10